MYVVAAFKDLSSTIRDKKTKHLFIIHINIHIPSLWNNVNVTSEKSCLPLCPSHSFKKTRWTKLIITFWLAVFQSNLCFSSPVHKHTLWAWSHEKLKSLRSNHKTCHDCLAYTISWLFLTNFWCFLSSAWMEMFPASVGATYKKANKKHISKEFAMWMLEVEWRLLKSCWT